MKIKEENQRFFVRKWFSMNLKVLRPSDGVMMKLVKYNLEGATEGTDTDATLVHNHKLNIDNSVTEVMTGFWNAVTIPVSENVTGATTTATTIVSVEFADHKVKITGLTAGEAKINLTGINQSIDVKVIENTTIEMTASSSVTISNVPTAITGAAVSEGEDIITLDTTTLSSAHSFKITASSTAGEAEISFTSDPTVSYKMKIKVVAA